GEDDLLNLVVEIKGYRREDAKEKKATMDTYWVPGVNHLGTHGRWAFAEFTDVYRIESSFDAEVKGQFHEMIARVLNARRGPVPTSDRGAVEDLLARNFGDNGSLLQVA